MRSTAAVLDHQLTLASVRHGRVEEAACAVAGEALDWTPRAAEVIRLAVENCPMHTAEIGVASELVDDFVQGHRAQRVSMQINMWKLL